VQQRDDFRRGEAEAAGRSGWVVAASVLAMLVPPGNSSACRWLWRWSC